MGRDLIQAEARRISGGKTSATESAGLSSFRFLIDSENSARSILEKAKTVLSIVDQKSLVAWPSIEEWRRLLPKEFVLPFRLPLSQEQAKEWLKWWRGLSPDDQMRVENERVWSLEDWLYWMEPNNRHWFWEDVEIIDNSRLRATILAAEWPFPWGSFRWFFLGAGAQSVIPED